MHERRILIVDDEEDNIVLLKEILELEGYENLITAQSSKEALDKLGMNIAEGMVSVGPMPPIDLALLDIMMPEMSGVELCRRLKRKNPFLPVILVSALNSIDDQVRGIEAGADDFITKPVAAEKLVARVRFLLARWQRDERLMDDYRNLKELHESLPPYVRLAAEVIDGYEVCKTLGRGAMAIVYKVRDRQSGNFYALKIMSEAVMKKAANIALFRAEIQHISALSHDSIIHISGHGIHQGFPYFIMEVFDSRTLQNLIAEKAGQVEAFLAIDILKRLAQALAHVHEHDILHRDLKLENVLINDCGDIRLTDFGLSIEEGIDLTATGLIGTPLYIAPELFNGFEHSRASDIYAFGILAFGLLSGRLPFEYKTSVELMHAHCHEAPPDISNILPDLVPGVAEIIQACLAKNPRRRPSSFSQISNIMLHAQ